MSGNTEPWRVRIRRDTAVKWALQNLILENQVMGLETDTRKFKIGNGLAPWRLLPYGSLAVAEGEMPLISTDVENRLTFGTDGGLFVAPEEVVDDGRDFLAYYILAKS